MSSGFEGLRRSLLEARPRAAADVAEKRAAADAAARRLEQIDDLIRSMGVDEPADPAPPTRTDDPPIERDGRRKIRAGSSAEYAIEVLGEAGDPLTPRQVVDRAVAAGWEAAGNEPIDAMRKSLRRLVRQGRIERVGDQYRSLTVTAAARR